MNIDKFAPFGQVLQTLRKQKKMRQQALADKLGVHRNTIGGHRRSLLNASRDGETRTLSAMPAQIWSSLLMPGLRHR